MNRQSHPAMRIIETGMRNHLRASHNRLAQTTEPQAVAAMAVTTGALAKALALALPAAPGGRLRGGDLTLLRSWLASATPAALAPAQGVLVGLALAAARDQTQATLRAVTVGGLAGAEWASGQEPVNPLALVGRQWRDMEAAGAVDRAGGRFNQAALAALDEAAAAGEGRAQALARLKPALAALAADLAAIARTLLHAVANSARLAAMAALQTPAQAAKRLALSRLPDAAGRRRPQTCLSLNSL